MTYKPTLEELKKDPSYRYSEFLCDVFDKAGINNEPIQIAIEAVMQADLPAYLPVSAAVTTKLLFILAIYDSQNRLGGMLDGVRGMRNMIGCVAKDWER